MAQIYFSTYEGVIGGYDLKLTDKELVFSQIINSQESQLPVRSLQLSKDFMYAANGSFVNQYNIHAKKLQNQIEIADKVDQILLIQAQILVAAQSRLILYDALSCGKVLDYAPFDSQIVSLCAYNSNQFLVLLKDRLVALTTQNKKVTSEMKLKDEYLQVCVLDQQNVVLIGQKGVVRLDLATQEQKAYEQEGCACVFSTPEFVQVGTQKGQVLVLDKEMAKIKKIQVGDARVKKIFMVQKDIYCALLSSGEINVYIFDGKDAFLIGQKKVELRILDGGAISDDRDEEQNGEEDEEKEENFKREKENELNDNEEEYDEEWGEEEGEEYESAKQ